MTKHTPEAQEAAQAAPGTAQQAGGIRWWVFIVVMLGAILLVTGAVISKIDPILLTGNSPMNDAGRVYADYLFARNLPLALLLLLLLALRARRMLAGFMALVALIQVFDCIDDLAGGAVVLVPGLLVIALVFFLGAWQLFGQAPWRLDTWREPQP